MPAEIKAPPRPTGFKRRLFRAPVWLYRAGLGWLLGHRFLLLAHRGRRSELKRYTVLEVVRFDRATRESIVTAAYGETCDWYRNIRAEPALEIRTGFDRYVPEQRFLNEEEAYRELSGYAERHPASMRAVARALGLRYEGTEAQRRAMAAAFRLVGFRPKSG